MLGFLKFTTVALLLFIRILARILGLFSSKIKKRILFEQKNQNERPVEGPYHATYEVSSEGEFEQAKYFIDRDLKQGLKVKIVFFSPSVENTIVKFQQQFQDQVAILRYPLLTFSLTQKTSNLFKFIDSRELFLCRYDFFPELFIIGKRKKRFVLLWASLKNKKTQGHMRRFIHRQVYGQFHLIVCPTQSQMREFLRLGISTRKLRVFEARVPQIQLRLSNTNHKIKMYEWLPLLMNKLSSKNQNIIFGSFYLEEKTLINKDLLHFLRSTGNTLVIIPHKINQQNPKLITEYVHSLDNSIIVQTFDQISTIEEVHQSMANQTPHIIVLNIKSVLCELYSFFKIAYVGGGFGYSVHSLLEPFIAGCFTICGPKTYRSTEIDYIQELAPTNIFQIWEKDDVSWQRIIDKSHQQIEIKTLTSTNSFDLSEHGP